MFLNPDTVPEKFIALLIPAKKYINKIIKAYTKCIYILLIFFLVIFQSYYGYITEYFEFKDITCFYI